ncbi:hypothetical protein ANCDUO_21232 [Ancylostoma duodenale]|uniref:Uncharacterized protein n=1 Tax=Ancylostoma duodenale TaxID=51022 RepID=A0A0C2FJA4_9BILA|nr:hypothetical protein ANCDUO_21232 [Ancylostoma duodenale]
MIQPILPWLVKRYRNTASWSEYKSILSQTAKLKEEPGSATPVIMSSAILPLAYLQLPFSSLLCCILFRC